MNITNSPTAVTGNKTKDNGNMRSIYAQILMTKQGTPVNN